MFALACRRQRPASVPSRTGNGRHKSLLALHRHGAIDNLILAPMPWVFRRRPFLDGRPPVARWNRCDKHQRAIEVIHYKIHIAVVIQVANRQPWRIPD